jgi:hypothetical protein
MGLAPEAAWAEAASAAAERMAMEVVFTVSGFCLLRETPDEYP